MSGGRAGRPAARRGGPGARGRAGRLRARAASRLRTVAPTGVLEARVPFAALCCGVIVVTLLSVLAINIQLSRGSYAAADLRAERRLLGEQEQALRERLAAAEAPDAVRARAVELGMVRAEETAFLSLAEAAVVEDGAPAAQAPPAGQEPVEPGAAEQLDPAGDPADPVPEVELDVPPLPEDPGSAP